MGVDCESGTCFRQFVRVLPRKIFNSVQLKIKRIGTRFVIVIKDLKRVGLPWVVFDQVDHPYRKIVHIHRQHWSRQICHTAKCDIQLACVFVHVYILDATVLEIISAPCSSLGPASPHVTNYATRIRPVQYCLNCIRLAFTCFSRLVLTRLEKCIQSVY